VIAFGPVPSKRLGRSLGINNALPKVCTYSCIYCQLGYTLRMQVDRQAFYEPGEIVQAVRDQVTRARESGEHIDSLAFVPDGEPTLDIHLGQGMALIKHLGVPTEDAVKDYIGTRRRGCSTSPPGVRLPHKKTAFSPG
jgi:wyosine [tRNA(Phe)-imidazoG37] synthetase (radical SAM superfamily)